MRKLLTESDRAMLSLCLRLGAAEFAKDALMGASGAHGSDLSRLVTQFNQQNRDAVRLAEWVEEADQIVIDPAK